MQVMSKAASVFATWDEEYENFRNILRGVAIRRGEVSKLSWRINCAHMMLQERMAKMTEYVVCAVGYYCQGNCDYQTFCCRFRKYYVVMLKVLKPTGQQVS